MWRTVRSVAVISSGVLLLAMDHGSIPGILECYLAYWSATWHIVEEAGTGPENTSNILQSNECHFFGCLRTHVFRLLLVYLIRGWFKSNQSTELFFFFWGGRVERSGKQITAKATLKIRAGALCFSLAHFAFQQIPNVKTEYPSVHIFTSSLLLRPRLPRLKSPLLIWTLHKCLWWSRRFQTPYCFLNGSGAKQSKAEEIPW
jgi:hypothetical protein